jgi:hypothetical protein
VYVAPLDGGALCDSVCGGFEDDILEPDRESLWRKLEALCQKAVSFPSNLAFRDGVVGEERYEFVTIKGESLTRGGARSL